MNKTPCYKEIHNYLSINLNEIETTKSSKNYQTKFTYTIDTSINITKLVTVSRDIHLIMDMNVKNLERTTSVLSSSDQETVHQPMSNNCETCIRILITVHNNFLFQIIENNILLQQNI